MLTQIILYVYSGCYLKNKMRKKKKKNPDSNRDTYILSILLVL